MSGYTLNQLSELKLEDLEEIDYILIWDESEGKTKKISLQTIIDFIQMMQGYETEKK